MAIELVGVEQRDHRTHASRPLECFPRLLESPLVSPEQKRPDRALSGEPARDCDGDLGASADQQDPIGH
jgi:hypothetical protein